MIEENYVCLRLGASMDIRRVPRAFFSGNGLTRIPAVTKHHNFRAPALLMLTSDAEGAGLSSMAALSRFPHEVANELGKMYKHTGWYAANKRYGVLHHAARDKSTFLEAYECAKDKGAGLGISDQTWHDLKDLGLYWAWCAANTARGFKGDAKADSGKVMYIAVFFCVQSTLKQRGGKKQDKVNRLHSFPACMHSVLDLPYQVDSTLKQP